MVINIGDYQYIKSKSEETKEKKTPKDLEQIRPEMSSCTITQMKF